MPRSSFPRPERVIPLSEQDELEARLEELARKQGGPSNFRYLTLRFIAAYMILGVLLVAILFADGYALTHLGTVKRPAVKSIVDRALKAAVGNQNVVSVCEHAVTASITQSGGEAPKFSKTVAHLSKDGTVRVTLVITSNIYTGPGHCILQKGVYQPTDVGPGT